tara:strand:+ start:417 stop:602 length:186 start_codon:yes stop_codon:yes gene_type:complete
MGESIMIDLSWINGSHFLLITIYLIHYYFLNKKIVRLQKETDSWKSNAIMLNQDLNKMKGN